MSRINDVEVKNYRCFDVLRVGGLTRANLFVGKNNCGKTALLEAIEAIVSVESPYLFYRASHERGETVSARRAADPETVHVDVRRWFRGHALPPRAPLSLSANGVGVSRVECAVGHQFIDGKSQLALLWRPQHPSSASLRSPFPLTPDGYLVASSPSVFLNHGTRLTPRVCFLTTRRLLPSEMMPLWAGVLLTPSENDVADALRLVAPSVERVALSGLGEAAQAVVSFKGANAPVPLGSLGEGSVRMLALALNLATARGGFLFVDEIETGLHYSVQRDMWRLVVATAQRLDIQVFATTHSKDCLEALAQLGQEAPELAAEVSVHRLEAGRSETVRFEAARVAEYLDIYSEVR
ncbi:MAG: AAA family ATPase [Planctomycetes bacterium]|nr:AAA family ATPase [Planctomycetota bacterium]